MIKLFAFLLLPVLSFSQQAEKEFKLKGHLHLSKPVDWVYLRYSDGNQFVMDSMQPAKDGEFKFEGKILEPTVANLAVKFVKNATEEKAQKDYLPIFLEPAKMEITAKDSLEANSVTGSSGQVDYVSLMKQQQPFTKRLSLLYEEYSRQRNAGDENGMSKVEDAINQAQDEMDEQVYAKFVISHPASPVALYALRQYAGYAIDPVKVEPLFNKLAASVRALPSAVSLKEQVEIAKKTAVGSYAMEFTQNDTLGQPVSLSSFKGKYVLVDFWASWCGPCRAENPNVVKAFQQFRDKNFTILSVSLDRPNAKDKWLKAIHDDGLTWNHVSDLKYWDNEVAKLYGIRAIPQNILLDPTGKIIAKNLKGAELEKKLAELL